MEANERERKTASEIGGTAESAQSSDSTRRRVVVIDDDEVMLLSCQAVLGKVGYQVELYDNGADGLRRIAELAPPVLLVDLKMPGIDGMEVIRRVRESSPLVVIVVITGHATVGTAVDAMRAGAYDFLPKPFTPQELRLIIDRSFERWALAREAEQLRREKQEAERRFITFVSHQLKSPLAAVRQYLDVLVRLSGGELSERATQWIARSHARVDEMLAMIDDWLTLARLERAVAALHDLSADLAPIVARSVETHEPHCAAKGVTVSVDIETGLPPLRGDAASLDLVVSNLLSNAIKYNRPGGQVAVRARLEGALARVDVQDTGIGISSELMPRLFQEFWRAQTAETANIPGTGLGLAICKRVVTDLGGRIEAASQPGTGTQFTVWLPVASPQSG